MNKQYNRESEVTKKEYAEHPIFEDLKAYSSFYNLFSKSVMFCGLTGVKSMFHIDTYMYGSIEGTLESITHVLKNGRIGDAFALLRKYYDSAVINVYVNLYLENNDSLKNFIVPEIMGWISGEKSIPRYRTIMQYIKKSSQLKPITNLLYKDNVYTKIKDRCNDHIHYNFFHNVLINDSQIYAKNRIELLNLIQDDIKNILILHLRCIFYLSDDYMRSSYYLDCLEFGGQPEENSQYWVAPFIQDVFHNLIAKHRPDIAETILNNTSMHLSKIS